VLTYSGFVEKLDRDTDGGRHVAGTGLSTSRTPADFEFERRQRCGKDAMRSRRAYTIRDTAHLLGPTASAVNFVLEQVVLANLGSSGSRANVRLSCFLRMMT
jgi:hypothetical protein